MDVLSVPQFLPSSYTQETGRRFQLLIIEHSLILQSVNTLVNLKETDDKKDLGVNVLS